MVYGCWSILLGGQGDHVRLSSINGGRFVCFYVGCSDLIKKNWVKNWCQKYKSKFITSFLPYVLPFHQLDQTQWADLEAKWGMSQHFVEQTCYKSPSYLPCENKKKKLAMLSSLTHHCTCSYLDYIHVLQNRIIQKKW